MYSMHLSTYIKKCSGLLEHSTKFKNLGSHATMSYIHNKLLTRISLMWYLHNLIFSHIYLLLFDYNIIYFKDICCKDIITFSEIGNYSTNY